MYSRLDSPLPNLTLSLEGCHACGARGLGDYPPLDITPTDNFGNLTPPDLPDNTISPITDPIGPFGIDLPDQGTIPIDPTSVGTSIESMYPSTVGTEFVSNGDGTYTNIQTGQSVPFNVAQEITAATAPPMTSTGGTAIDTTGTETGVNLTDPTTGQSYSGTLTNAAKALQSAGLLVTAAGKLTAEGQALAQSGQLIARPASAGANVSAALSSLSNWFSAQSLMAGVSNGVVLGGVAVGLMVLSSMMSGKKRRRR